MVPDIDWLVPLRVTVDVPWVKVPELDQLPVRVMAPELTCRVPALATFPGTLRVLALRLSVTPKGIVIPAAYARPVIKEAATTITIKIKVFLNSLSLLVFI